MSGNTPEGKVKRRIDSLLNANLVYFHKPVGNGMGAPALDYHVCHKGCYAGIEAKSPTGKPTERQIRTMIEVRAAGGSVFLIHGESSLDFASLQGWLKDPKPACIGPMARLAMDEYEEFKRKQKAESENGNGTDDRLGDIEHIHRSIGGGD